MFNRKKKYNHSNNGLSEACGLSKNDLKKANILKVKMGEAIFEGEDIRLSISIEQIEKIINGVDKKLIAVAITTLIHDIVKLKIAKDSFDKSLSGVTKDGDDDDDPGKTLH